MSLENVIIDSDIDSQGNVYSVGYFKDTTDFDIGVAVYSLLPINFYNSFGAQDIFITKMDKWGNLVWAKQVGGNDRAHPLNIVVDHAGNVVYSGGYTDSIDVDPGAANYTLIRNSGFSQTFVSKLDSAGNFIWGRNVPLSTWSSLPPFKSTPIVIDDVDNIYLTGASLVKVSSAGNLVWVKQSFGSEMEYAQGRIHFAGEFNGTMDFDPGPNTYNLSSGSNSALFISAIDTNGNFAWAQAYPTISSYATIKRLAIDNQGDIYCFGFFGDSIDFDPTPAVSVLSAGPLNSPLEAAIFLTKLNATGNLIWAHKIAKFVTGAGDSYLHLGVPVATGGVIASASFTAGSDFDPGPNTYSLTVNSFQNLNFIARYSTNGNFVSAKSFGECLVNAMVLNTNEDLYLSGRIGDSCDLAPGMMIQNAFGPGGFITKWSPTPTPLSVSLEFNARALSIRAVKISWKIEQAEEVKQFEVQKSTDGIHWSTMDVIKKEGNSKDYELLDEVPYTKNYYRLKVIRMDNDSFYSKTRTVLFESNSDELTIYPNPTNGHVLISAQAKLENAKMRLVNSIGGVVLEKDNITGSSFELDITQNAAGLYMLEVYNADGVSRIKVLKR